MFNAPPGIGRYHPPDNRRYVGRVAAVRMSREFESFWQAAPPPFRLLRPNLRKRLTEPD